MGYRLKTEMEQALHAECEAWRREDFRWREYARRLRQQREDHRRLLGLVRAYLVRQPELDTPEAAPARDQLVERIDRALRPEAL